MRTAFSLRSGFALFLAMTIIGSSTNAQVYDSPKAAEDDFDFELQGEYVESQRAMQVIADGDGEFTVKIYNGGLPGDGWDGTAIKTLEVDDVTAEAMISKFEKVERKSPTLGAKPPLGAVVLFDGTKESLAKHWKKGARITEDGLLQEGCTSIDTFGDYTLHLEFRTPFQPSDKGQKRGNSGLYHQGRYETQILDSFGLAGKNNETGGIYEIRDPDLNMCFPPLSWQTYDVDFTAARYDENGKKTSNAVISVRLNGVYVHRDVELPRGTRAAPVKEGPEDGPIYLQNHGNPVRFRNIWVKPRDLAAEARRPIVPGFERFHASGSASVEGGRVLLGELNCVACHSADETLVALASPKQAPILDGVGKRVHAEWMINYLANPRAVKPGTTMPDVLGSMNESERKSAAIALTNFLVGTDAILIGGKRADSKKGETLFHQSGCVACHMPRNGTKVNPATSIPLVGLDEKYTRGSLEAFLKDPLAVRPSGRMPHLDLGDNGWADVAQYLTGDTAVGFAGGNREMPKTPNVKFAVYEGGWSKLPDFDKLAPTKTGVAKGLDINVAGLNDNFGVRFDGFLPIEQAGKYSFQTISDDGSRLYIDGKMVVNNDGIHGSETAEGSIRLTPGVHTIRVEYFEAGGGEDLRVNWAGPGLKSGGIDKAILLDRNAADLKEVAASEEVDPDVFAFNPALVETGRQLFRSLGCASCHERHENGKRIESAITAPSLADCDEGGCLGGEPKPGVPNFELLDTQSAALAAAVKAGSPKGQPTADMTLSHSMTAMNCYACHGRDGIGGPESDRNALFISTIPEMGDEGRLPPSLDGVGDKLREDWMKKVVRDGDKSRPYMKTFMPRFGSSAESIVSTFAKLDSINEAKYAELDEPENRIVSTGRKMVGSKGLACVSCHTFGKFKSTGIQAIALDTMAARIRKDWFHRYLPNPQKYRPGTRMPNGFPEGKSTVMDIYGGDKDKQLASMWAYLAKGTGGGVPEGIVGGMIELKPDDKPVIYRNFIEGASPRGIAVGYPEKANLCWDANTLALTVIWQDRFIDASKHWVGRGPGKQVPLGGSVAKFETTVPVAVLGDADEPWPTDSPKELGYKFLGYRLDKLGRPTFRYRAGSFHVEDTPIPVNNNGLVGTFKRSLTITPIEGSDPAGQVFVRVAAGNVEAKSENTFELDGAIQIGVESAEAPIVRQSNGKTEVLIPVSGPTTVTQSINW